MKVKVKFAYLHDSATMLIPGVPGQIHGCLPERNIKRSTEMYYDTDAPQFLHVKIESVDFSIPMTNVKFIQTEPSNDKKANK